MPTLATIPAGLALALNLLVLAGESPDAPLMTRSRDFDLNYVVNEAAKPVRSVALWYTRDRGQSWQLLGYDEDRRSPYRIHAPEEGLYGFFLIVSNGVGPSSAPPTSSTAPFLWVLVDDSPPVVQLHPIQRTSASGQRVAQIRWTALDANFGPRPIMVQYQTQLNGAWKLLDGSPFSNTGRLDWRIPDSLTGPVWVRLTVLDKGGHEVISPSQVIDLPPIQRSLPIGLSQIGQAPSSRLASDGMGIVTGSARARERAETLYQRAVEHRERGEYREGIAVLREVVRLNPRAVHAIAEMAEMFYRIGDLDHALSAYRLALQQEPTLRSALRGAAMVYRQQGEYPAAARNLRTILRYNPHDAEVWMNLGDVAIYQGDEALAKECYTRAAQIDPDASRIIADARQRLSLMETASRRYQPGKP